jgi:4-hydroxy-tetrahydrodipicolinate reductase
MRIALIGYGKMGKTIERLAKERGHEIVTVFNSSNPYEPNAITNADVAIEFTRPDTVLAHIEIAIKQALPIVVGTTAWGNHLPEVKNMVDSVNGSLLYASNFSIGVNIFQQLTESLARLMAHQRQYQFTIDEIHHVQKLDAPSGTAVTLAEGIIANHSTYKQWTLNKTTEETDLLINAYRIPDVPGTHSIKASSLIDTITLTHEAHNREGFALGAILAAEFLLGKTGVFTMKDVLKLT